MGYFDGNMVTALWAYAQRFAMSDIPRINADHASPLIGFPSCPSRFDPGRPLYRSD